MAPLQGPSNATTRADTGRIEGAGRAMEIRHLDALLAITESGSFSAAAEVLHTVQSNVSEQIRQLERELGVPVLVRGRRGATPTEFGRVVLERARRIRGELGAMRVDLSLLQGLGAGHASLGVVGTARRRLLPALVGDLRQRAPGVVLRLNEGAPRGRAGGGGGPRAARGG